MSDPSSSTPPPPPLPAATVVSRHELNTSFHQFMLVLIHSVLYHRRIYPAMSFRPVRYAGLAVWQSRHPGVCAWVRSMMESAMEVVAKFAATHISIIILDNQDRVRERYTLALTAFTPADAGTETADIFNKPDQPAVSWGTVNQEYRSLLATAASFLQNHTFSDRRQSAASAAASDGGGNNGGGGGGNEKFDVFRDEDDASNLQGSFTQAEEGGRRDDWSFSVTVEVPPGGVDSDAEMPADFPWVSSDPTTLSARSPNPHLVHGDRVYPIRYTDLGALQFNFYLEETDI